MNDELQNNIAQSIKDSYPQLFDYEVEDKQLNNFIKQAFLKCKKYQSVINDDEYFEMLMTYYSAYLLQANQETDGITTSIKADVLQVNTSSNFKGSDYFLNLFNDLLDDLGLSSFDWGVHLW